MSSLRSKLSKDFLLENGVSDLEAKFDEIAEILLTKTKIKKGALSYDILDIEFYLFCKGHEDIITYPRNCEAGEWFFHNSGVDITFKSNKVNFIDNGSGLKAVFSNDENIFFGGILLRGIKLSYINNHKGITGKNLNGHPQNVCHELFDKFNALEPIIAHDYPYLEILDEAYCEFNRSDDKKRINLLNKDQEISDKVKSICSKNYYGGKSIYQPEFDKYFKKHLDKPYRYTLK